MVRISAEILPPSIHPSLPRPPFAPPPPAPPPVLKVGMASSTMSPAPPAPQLGGSMPVPGLGDKCWALMPKTVTTDFGHGFGFGSLVGSGFLVFRVDFFELDSVEGQQ